MEDTGTWGVNPRWRKKQENKEIDNSELVEEPKPAEGISSSRDGLIIHIMPFVGLWEDF